MSPIRLLKFEAVALKERESASGRAIKYREALERVAKRRGYHGWRACCSVLATTTVVECAAPNEAAARATTGMRRYRNTDWNFALDIPAPWKSFPPVANSSPFEVVRFKSNEDGSHFLIVLRQPHSPERSLTEIADNTQKALRRKEFMNFEFAETTTGSGTALVHSFNKPHPSETWSFRNYPHAIFSALRSSDFTSGFRAIRIIPRRRISLPWLSITASSARFFVIRDSGQSWETLALVKPSFPDIYAHE
jgi:hypothetical protein